MPSRSKMFIVINLFYLAGVILIMSDARLGHPGMLRWIQVVTPCIFMVSLWSGYRQMFKLSDAIEADLDPERHKLLYRLREQANMQNLFASAGLAVAFFTGYSLAHH